ncbi:Probable serine/threonine-protein kinase kinX [Geodia barretti]|uniref:Probable serine/threonine-protein kinase kinX n=1 Tax=Geodia barretti TaxID=519541 RepID=A0AA35WYR1_GEOBA|nr:Probable serine/threonine-protein kinase kinX [Geodia barretti]
MATSADVHVHLGGQFGYQNVHVHTSKVLGTGSYGSVVKATLDHLPCAAKILHTVFFRDDDPGAADFAARFDQECDILRALKHPCIVQFLGVVQDPSSRRPILLMELMEESLTGFLERAMTSLPYHVQVNITHDIALALAYLHGNSIIHRDLSSNNILLRGGGSQAKVTDFGMSKMVEANPRMTRSKITQCPGTPVFMPPEALRAKPRYSDKLDTFSLGVVTVQIITRCFPTPTDAEIVVEDETSPTGEKILPVPELQRRQRDIGKVPPDHGLLPTALHCLKDRPRDRPSAAQLCQSLGQLKDG